MYFILLLLSLFVIDGDALRRPLPYRVKSIPLVPLVPATPSPPLGNTNVAVGLSMGTLILIATLCCLFCVCIEWQRRKKSRVPSIV